MTDIRILTVRQPYAWAIIHGGKDVENRVRNIAGDYRGLVAIHAAARELPIGEHMDAAKRVGAITGYLPLFTLPQQRGAIIGVVDLVGVHEGHNSKRSRMESVLSCYRAGKPFGPCSPWADPDAWHLELANPRPLAEPIPYRGALGLRRLPEDAADMVRKAVAS